jgi:hypothetical protein
VKRYCLRTDGSQRATFETIADAEKFRTEHPEQYGQDQVVFCTRCMSLHLSHPSWKHPWEVRVLKTVVH